jgi:hypothetical protein
MEVAGVITLSVARRGTGKEEGDFSGFQGIQCGMFIKL